MEAASFDWETLMPVLFFIIYGIVQLIGLLRKDKPGEEEEEDSSAAEDAMERARKVREDIKRKIQQRREQGEGGRPAPTADQSHYDPNLPESQQQRPAPAPVPAPMQRRQPEPVHEARPVNRTTDLEKRLKQQQKRLEESRRRQQEAREQTRKMQEQARGGRQARNLSPRRPSGKPSGVVRPAALRARLLHGLKDPARLREAVLYREILDPPVGLR